MPVHLVVRPEDASRLAREWAARAAAFPPWVEEHVWRWTAVPHGLKIQPRTSLGPFCAECAERWIWQDSAGIRKVTFVCHLHIQVTGLSELDFSHFLPNVPVFFPQPRGGNESGSESKSTCFVSPPGTPFLSFHVKCLPRSVPRTFSLVSHLSKGMTFSLHIYRTI